MTGPGEQQLNEDQIAEFKEVSSHTNAREAPPQALCSRTSKPSAD